LDSFVLKILSPRLITHSSAHSLPAHWVCTTCLHHCLSLTNWDVVKNFHLWVFHPNSSWHKSQSTVGFERQWCRWVVHTLWACSEWADQWVTDESWTPLYLKSWVQDSSPTHQPAHYLLISYVQPACILVSEAKLCNFLPRVFPPKGQRICPGFSKSGQQFPSPPKLTVLSNWVITVCSLWVPKSQSCR
jgi:hypothetical protein